MSDLRKLRDRNFMQVSNLLIIIYVLSVSSFLLIGIPSLLNLAFPFTSFLLGLYFYFKKPTYYVGFSLWLWFLTPLVRRITDYFSHFTDPSPILLTPLLVTFISILSIKRLQSSRYRRVSLSFSIAIISITYGLLIGMIQQPVQDTLIAFSEWLCPILFGLHLFSTWREYPRYSSLLKQVFTYGALVMGSYGIWQFIRAPEWDAFWLLNSGTRSFGLPEPFSIRVWGTMNSPQDFAVALIPCLLLLFICRNLTSFLPIIISSVAILLTSARAPWLGLFVGIICLLATLKIRFKLKVIASILVGIFLVLPVVNQPPFSTIIGARFETLLNLGADNSLADRTSGYGRLTSLAISELFGKGLGYRFEDITIAGNDGTILPMLFSLGWFGTVLYLIGFFSIAFTVMRSANVLSDPFISCSKSIFVAIFVQIGFNFVLIAPMGIFLWSFLGITLAGQHYQKYYRKPVF